MQCVANGHTVIALGNLHPKPQDNKGIRNKHSLLPTPLHHRLPPSYLVAILMRFFLTTPGRYCLETYWPIFIFVAVNSTELSPTHNSLILHLHAHSLSSKTNNKIDELDSYMYQTVGHDVIYLYKDCLEVPLYRQEIKGKPVEQGADYVKTDQDETEDLFELLSAVKAAHPDLEAVSVGAILSNYQRIRVENV